MLTLMPSINFSSGLSKEFWEKSAGTGEEHIQKLFQELLKYAEFHFCSEENMMEEYNYPEIPSIKLSMKCYCKNYGIGCLQ